MANTARGALLHAPQTLAGSVPRPGAAPDDKRHAPARDRVQFERERRLQSAEAAKEALAAKKHANELRAAALGAGDPDHRQQLLEEALDRENAAESFGKTAKYLRSGTFQGMAVGVGLGVVPGLTLGVLTGVLVAGTVSLILGGLGAAGGALTGLIHGPFWNMGQLIGQGVRRITGDGPSWETTPDQRRQLEKMIGQCREEKMPSDAELQDFVDWTKGREDLFLGGLRGKLSGYVSAFLPGFGSGNPFKRYLSPAPVQSKPEVDGGARTPMQQASLQCEASTEIKKVSGQSPALPQHSMVPGASYSSRQQASVTIFTRQIDEQGQELTIRQKPRKLEIRAKGVGDDKLLPRSTTLAKGPRKLAVRQQM